MGTRFSEGNLAAKKLDWQWTEEEIRSYQSRIRPIIESIGLAEVARLMDYQESYVKLVAGHYDELRQPSEEFVQRFENAVLLHHIRTVTIPFLRERERLHGGRTWTREGARKAKSRMKRRKT